MDKLERFAIYLTTIRWMDILAFLIGAVLLNEFFSLWDAHFFTPSGMSQRLTFLATHNNFVVLKNLLRLVAHGAAILGPLTAIILFLTAAAIILFIMRGFMLFTATLIFFFYYLSHLGVPGIWTFEYLLPFLYSGCVWLSFLPDRALLQRKNKRIQFFGFKVFENKQVSVNVILILVASLLLWYVNYLSNNLNQLSNLVGIKTAITFAILGIISLLMDKLRYKNQGRHDYDNSAFRTTHPIYAKLLHFPWLELLTVLIGAMLVFQIYEDYLLHWFTITGYQQLIDVYGKYSHSLPFFRTFIEFLGTKAEIIMPIQLVVESICALSLVILVLRAPFMIIATLLFGLLTYVEFGVPATWPPAVPPIPTWTWELLFTLVVSIILSLYHTGIMLRAKNAKERFLGIPIFKEAKFYFRFSIACFSGLLLTLIVTLSGTLGKFNPLAAIESGLTLFFYIIILSVIDYGR
ncbi:hypothetical protein [Coxiella burnetii]|uniref:hypothetical protein n=1 Tax=Coxiella burnetii TaxID=777 RepID=UPI0002E63D1F|nr:hypothetical protein [Coxiella burnetii]AIT62934.1 Putative membrane protein [Coxiella burnetii str. Namibia]ATN85368.1 hypothetical protein AYO29_02060 [Coxiella burnetii str. Schperling]PHH58252.1 hypothetical protein CRH12_00340 [Coxiella burnetii]